MLICLLSVLACSDYELSPDLPESEMVDPSGDGSAHDPSDPGASEGDPGGDPSRPGDSNGDPSGDPSDDPSGDPSTPPWEGDTPRDTPDVPPVTPPPEFLDDDCLAVQIAPFSSDEIWVGNNANHRVASGVLTATAPGWYHVYDTHIVESGASQHNESAFFRIPNATHPDGLPAFPNCLDDRVVVDADNQGPPPGNQTLIGTFWLDAGDNPLVMTHYCELYGAGACPEHHITDEPGQTCESGNINSVHFLGFAVCLVPAR